MSMADGATGNASDRVTVIGAGATGAYLAARLAAADIPVTVIARGESLERIGAEGIELEHPDGRRETVRPAAVAAPGDEIARAALAVFCVKTYDTDAASALVDPLLRPDGRVLCLQNGVKSEQILAEAVGAPRVLSGVLYIGAQRLAPGVIKCSAPPRVVVGPYDGADLAASADVEALLSKAGIACTVEPNVRGAKWQKFLFNCGLNPLTAITRQRLGRLLAIPEAHAAFDALVDEAATVALAAGAPLPADCRDITAATAARMDISSSMAEDLAAGRPIELDAFSGYVIALGERHGVATPATRLVHGLLAALNEGREGTG
jgi:2-dehydropantoate 2-reductase